MAVVDTTGQAIYLNASIRRHLRLDGAALPPWSQALLLPMIERLRGGQEQVVETWAHEGTTYRVRARPLGHRSGQISLELSVLHAAQSESVPELLCRNLNLNRSDANLLELVWRGMSNEEIATKIGVRLGTIKSRLFRLYQKLGVRRRPAAVLRAAEVIGGPGRGSASDG